MIEKILLGIGIGCVWYGVAWAIALTWDIWARRRKKERENSV